MQNDIVKRTITLNVPLEHILQVFGFSLNLTDPNDQDILHYGYDSNEVSKMDLLMPDKYSNIQKHFPEIIAQVLEDYDKIMYSKKIYDLTLSAIEENLKKVEIVNKGASYTYVNGDHIAENAGVLDVFIDKQSLMVQITINNPEHLFNAILDGVGFMTDVISPYEPASDSLLLSNVEVFNLFFKVYSSSKKIPELPNHWIPSNNEEILSTLIQNELDQYDKETLLNMLNIEDFFINDESDIESYINKISKYTDIDEMLLKIKIFKNKIITQEFYSFLLTSYGYNKRGTGGNLYPFHKSTQQYDILLPEFIDNNDFKIEIYEKHEDLEGALIEARSFNMKKMTTARFEEILNEIDN